MTPRGGTQELGRAPAGLLGLSWSLLPAPGDEGGIPLLPPPPNQEKIHSLHGGARGHWLPWGSAG